MIGRFFSAFTPGGWTGLNAYRLYDIAARTGKTARSAAAIGIEMVLGQLAFGVVVVAGSIFGVSVVGMHGVLLVDAFFVAAIVLGIVLVARPALFRKLGELLPAALRGRMQTTIDAVCAYQGRGGLVAGAAALGVATHTFNNLIYVCTARALGVQLGMGEVFFVSAMQIFATLVPASVNGIGVREATAVALYTRLGVPMSAAFLIPTIGFAVDMAFSALAARCSWRGAAASPSTSRCRMPRASTWRAPRTASPSRARTSRTSCAGWRGVIRRCRKRSGRASGAR